MPLNITPSSEELILAGALLFLIGLTQGIIIPFMKNPRMALSAHTDGVQSGLALMVYGIVWSLVDLSPLWQNLAYFSAIIGFYGLWIGITWASATGASRALPMAGEGYSGTPTAELIVIALTRISGTLILLSSIALVIGLL